jgi:hypothetical protein
MKKSLAKHRKTAILESRQTAINLNQWLGKAVLLLYNI